MVPDKPWRISCVNKMELVGEKERNVRERPAQFYSLSCHLLSSVQTGTLSTTHVSECLGVYKVRLLPCLHICTPCLYKRCLQSCSHIQHWIIFKYLSGYEFCQIYRIEREFLLVVIQSHWHLEFTNTSCLLLLLAYLRKQSPWWSLYI